MSLTSNSTPSFKIDIKPKEEPADDKKEAPKLSFGAPAQTQFKIKFQPSAPQANPAPHKESETKSAAKESEKTLSEKEEEKQPEIQATISKIDSFVSESLSTPASSKSKATPTVQGSKIKA